MKSKRGIGLGLIAAMIVVVLVGGVVLGILFDPIKKGATYILKPILKPLGLLDEDSEQEEINQKVRDDAKKVFNEFKTVFNNCKDATDFNCACGEINFENLNRYSIKLTTDRGPGKITETSLGLLDSSSEPVEGDSIDRNYQILPKEIKEDSDKYSEYNKRYGHQTFSISQVRYVTIDVDGDVHEDNKFDNKMRRIFFSKSETDVIVFDDEPIPKCEGSCPVFDYCSDYNQEQCGNCGTAGDLGCQWVSYGGESECESRFKGPALIVKIDTEEENTQVWEFRITSNKNILVGQNEFRLDDFDHRDSGQECVVLAVEENAGGHNDDAQVWYVKPGSLIEKRDVGRLWDGLLWNEPINEKHDCDDTCTHGQYCVTECGNKDKASPDPKDSSKLPILWRGEDRNTIGGEWYTAFSKDDDKDKCGNNECELLETSSGRRHWKPKYEILCDDEGIWNVCDRFKRATLEGEEYVCKEDGKWENQVLPTLKKAIGTRILYVKIDPEGNPLEGPIQTWAFHLTDDENLPIDKDGDGVGVDRIYQLFKDEVGGKKVCNVFSINEEGGQDHMATWYVNPGGRIMTKWGATDMFTGIKDKIRSVYQNNAKKKASPFPDDSDESVGETFYYFGTDDGKCGDRYHSCHLLDTENNKYMFTPKYELLCDDEGFWRVCDSYVERAITITSDRITYECGENDFSKWVWRSPAEGFREENKPPIFRDFPEDKWDVIWYDDPKRNGFFSFNILGSDPDIHRFAGSDLYDFTNDFGKGVLFDGKKDNIGLQARRSICFGDGNHVIFELGSDDGSKLYMDDDLKIDNWGDHSYSEKSFERTFAGSSCHNFLIEYYEKGGNARIHFRANFISP